MRKSTRFEYSFLAKILEIITQTINLTFCLQCRLLTYSCCWSEPFCRSKNGKTTTVFLTCFVSTTFLQNLVLKRRRYHVFPAKMTLVCARSMLLYEKISYSSSFSSQNLKHLALYYCVDWKKQMLGKMIRLRDSVVFKFIHCICQKAELVNVSSKLEQA